MAEVEQEIGEYQAQLASIEQLLEATPDDESLLALKKDLVELLELTKSSASSGTTTVAEPASPPPPMEWAVDAGAAAALMATVDVPPPTGDAETGKKKSKKVMEFVVPPHLIVNETDSEADKKKKYRALKALKSQHREKKREFEHEKKQNAWQSFQKKKKSGDGSSIFATQESVNDRVGVVSKKTKTDFGSRQRHKPL
jgi:survival-of-motor-neuron-related-splicing factor 30